MELLLNLAWLLLALPAYWLWNGRKNPRACKFAPVQFLLALGCILVVLFPVISVTDDLCAMRAECEESPAGKHSVRQQHNERLSASRWNTEPAALATLNSSFAPTAGWFSTSVVHLFTLTGDAHLSLGRAPPSVVLS